MDRKENEEILESTKDIIETIRASTIDIHVAASLTILSLNYQIIQNQLDLDEKLDRIISDITKS